MGNEKVRKKITGSLAGGIHDCGSGISDTERHGSGNWQRSGTCGKKGIIRGKMDGGNPGEGTAACKAAGRGRKRSFRRNSDGRDRVSRASVYGRDRACHASV